jgi:preprotein translocase subunit SecA
VLVGTTSVEISELLSRMLKLRGIRHNVLNAKQHQKEAQIVAEAGIAGTVTIATNMAGRGTDIKLGPGVKEAGGLAIVGTERHESRRVDRQLRGRSGRQGDPGSSQFFVSLEDNLMRLFGSDRIAKLMDRMGIEEGEVIQHSMITKSIERAQKKVEENNFGIRKRLIEYDDVMNAQRDKIYTMRRHALFGERLSLDIANMFEYVSEALVNDYHEAKDYEGYRFELLKLYALEPPLTEQEFFQVHQKETSVKTFHLIHQAYGKKAELTAQRAFPVIKDVFENPSQSYENIVVPFTDGMKTLQVIVNLKKAYETQAKEVVKEFEKGVILAMIDEAWKEHLREMDDLKQSVQNAVWEQKDPLVIYKIESYRIFKRMLDETRMQITSFMSRAKLPSESQNVQQSRQPVKTDLSKLKTSRPETVTSGNGQQEDTRQPVKAEKKVGRNDPCPCGSGKKFKHCHGR